MVNTYFKHLFTNPDFALLTSGAIVFKHPNFVTRAWSISAVMLIAVKLNLSGGRAP
jgi:hypothetical protein